MGSNTWIILGVVVIAALAIWYFLAGGDGGEVATEAPATTEAPAADAPAADAPAAGAPAAGTGTAGN